MKIAKNKSLVSFGKEGIGKGKGLVWKAVLRLDQHDVVLHGEWADNSILKDRREKLKTWVFGAYCSAF